MKDNPVAKNAHKFNKSQVMKDRKKAMKKGDRKHKGSYENVSEVLKVSDGVAAWIKDFQSSDAPQFKGKSMDKRKEMALAAYLDAKRGEKEESKSVTEWKRTSSETTHRVKGGDKRKKYMKEKIRRAAEIEEGLEEKTLHVDMQNMNGPEEKKILDILRNNEVKGNIVYAGETDKGLLFDIKKPAALRTVNNELSKAVRGVRLESTIEEAVKEPTGKLKDTCWKGYTAVGMKMKNGKKVPNCVPKEGRSAQDRLDARAAKHGLGNSKAADDYQARLMKKYGAKDMADLKKKMGMKEALTAQQRSVIGKASDAKRREKTSTQNAVKKAAQRAQVNKRVNENFRTLATKGMGAEKKSDIKVGHTVDYYDSKQGDKHTGEIVKMGPRNYQVKDERTGKVHTFNYYDPTKARKLMKESAINELTQRELDMMAARKQKNLVKRGKAKAEPKSSAGRVSNVGRAGGSDNEDDSSLVMQLRKAKDLRGNYEIKFKGGKTKLPPQLIDKLLNTYDKLQKPADKKKFETLVTHELRKKEGIAPQRSQTAADKAMDKFNKSKGKGIPAPRGKKSEPTDFELRNIERGL